MSAHRVIVWGPGSVGGHTLRSMLEDPSFDVIGVRVYSESKDGKDIGELVGIPPVGVAATTNVADLIALDADCVVHTPLAFDPDSMDAEVIELLRSGKNVVSQAAYHNPEMGDVERLGASGAEYTERLRQACLEGGSSLMGAGIHPNFVFTNLLLPLTGAMTDVKEVLVHEFLDLSNLLSDMGGGDNPLVAALGFGVPPDAHDVHSVPAIMLDVYYDEMAAYLGSRLFGAKPEDIRVEHELTGVPAEEDTTFENIPGLTIRKGTSLTVLRTQRAYIGDHHFFTNEDVWYIGDENRHVGTAPAKPEQFTGTVNYLIRALGEPSEVKLHFALDDEPGLAPVVTRVSVAVLKQSVPVAIAAKPGFVYRGDVVPHFSRTLA
jgi:hypothetical protein